MLRNFLDQFFRSVQRYWQLYLLLVLALFFLMRLHWSIRVLSAAVFVFVALIAILGAVVAVVDSMTDNGSEPQFLQRLVERANSARSRISELRKEAREIEIKIKELETLTETEKLTSGKQWGRGKSLALLTGYQEELALREAKAEFYARSMKTLTELNEKWRQERRLNELQNGLKRLRTPVGKDEQLKMLELKEDLTREQELLKSYKELSKRLDKSDSLANAQLLRKELERLLN